MLDEYRPPTWKDRLLHPLSIATILLVLVGGSVWGHGAWKDAERARVQAAVEPLQREWERILADAPARLASIEDVLVAAPPPVAQPCDALTGTIEVVHRPVLQALAAGERFPRIDAPHWLSTPAHRTLAGTTTPGLDEQAYRERNETVTSALARPCVAVLETELAHSVRMHDERSFDGGAVVGWLRVVCLDEPRIACQAPVASLPLFAVVVEQRNERAQASANAMAATGASASEYWQAVEAALGPGVTVPHGEH